MPESCSWADVLPGFRREPYHSDEAARHARLLIANAPKLRELIASCPSYDGRRFYEHFMNTFHTLAH
jgi:hypothetical protein